jgi:aldose 1-epimerase
MQGLRVSRARLALASAGAMVASLGMLATLGPAAATAAPAHPAHHHKSGGSKPKITSVPWGNADGTSVALYTLKGGGGMKAKISTYGGVVQKILVPDKQGKLVDVALGFPNLADYVADFTQGYNQTSWPVSGGSGDTYFGSIVGRYANRIAKGTFPLNNTTYTLDINNGVNSLHGGYLGWNTHVWSATPSTNKKTAKLTLTASFPAGEGCTPSLTPGCTGFPAPVNATVVYSVTKNNQLKISYSATNASSTLATVINLTNHTYFNLGGQASGDVYDQDLALNSNQYTPTDSTQIPEAPYFLSVKGTPYDFRSMHTIGKYIRATNLPDGTSGPIRQLQYAHGYDNNWVLNGYGTNNSKYRKVAVAQDPGNGITMWTYTDQPGVQLYTGNYLVGDLTGTTGTDYRQGDAFTLETQHYPDAPNHQGQANWPSAVLDAGQTFTSRTAYKFGVEGSNYASTVHFK